MALLHHPQNKPKISGVKNETLIKYKKIKWTPIGKTLRLFPSQGDLKNQKMAHLQTPTSHLLLNKTNIFGVESEILLKYKNQMDTCRKNATLIPLSGGKHSLI